MGKHIILRELVQLCFIKTECPTQMQIPCVRKEQILFCKNTHSDSTKKFSEIDIIKMLEFLIDNIFVRWTCLQQTVGIHMGTNCTSFPADLFLYQYETDFILALPKKNEKRLAPYFNFTFRYIDGILSLNNSRFGDFVDRIYLIELEIKDTTDTDRYVSYLDLHLEIDSEGRLRTKLYDKRDDFNFPIVNFPFICSNIPAEPAYGLYICQLIRYSTARGLYQDFLDRGLLLTGSY